VVINLKNKLIIILNIVAVLGCIIGDIILGINYKFDYRFYYSSIFFIIGIAIICLVFLIIHLLIDNTYTFNKFVPIMHSSYLVISAIMYYIVEWTKNLSDYLMIYWFVLGCLIVVDLIVFIILIIVKKEDSTPKFMVNNQ